MSGGQERVSDPLELEFQAFMRSRHGCLEPDSGLLEKDFPLRLSHLSGSALNFCSDEGGTTLRDDPGSRDTSELGFDCVSKRACIGKSVLSDNKVRRWGQMD